MALFVTVRFVCAGGIHGGKGASVRYPVRAGNSRGFASSTVAARRASVFGGQGSLHPSGPASPAAIRSGFRIRRTGIVPSGPASPAVVRGAPYPTDKDLRQISGPALRSRPSALPYPFNRIATQRCVDPAGSTHRFPFHITRRSARLQSGGACVGAFPVTDAQGSDGEPPTV